MGDREQLMELIGDCKWWGSIEEMVDYLLANGVTVQECKVGDTIYEADDEHGVIKHDVYEVVAVFKTTATDDNENKWDDYWTSEDIGNAYRTRHEAEANWPQPPKEIVYCKDCEHLMFSDCYGECAKAYKGIVHPNDTCEHGVKRVPKGEEGADQ